MNADTAEQEHEQQQQEQELEDELSLEQQHSHNSYKSYISGTDVKTLHISTISGRSFTLRVQSSVSGNDVKQMLADIDTTLNASPMRLVHDNGEISSRLPLSMSIKDEEALLTLLFSRSQACADFLQWPIPLGEAGDEVRADRECVLHAVAVQPANLRDATEFQNSKDVVLAAVKANGYALHFASAELRNDKDVVLAAVETNGRALQAASAQLRSDKDVVLSAVKNDIGAFEFAGEELRNDKGVVLTVVKIDGLALREASAELRDDIDVVLAAIDSNKTCLHLASDRLQQIPELSLLADGPHSKYFRSMANMRFKCDKSYCFLQVARGLFCLHDARDTKQSTRLIPKACFAVVTCMIVAIVMFVPEASRLYEGLLIALGSSILCQVGVFGSCELLQLGRCRRRLKTELSVRAKRQLEEV